MDKNQLPDYYYQEEYQNRSEKLRQIRDLGIDPYPHKYSVPDSVEQIVTRYSSAPPPNAEVAASGQSDLIVAAGRLVLFRAMGKNAFAQIQDDTGRLQLMFNRDLTTVEGLTSSSSLTPLKFIEKKLDLGDIIGVSGHVFLTKKQELTIYVKHVTLLSKSLLPLPDKHAGLQDKGLRYHKRWLDLISNQESMTRFKLRSQIIHKIRSYLHDAEFLEVETPILQPIYGGAEADPFVTDLKAQHKKMYLRIATEISLKKLLVGGMPRVYEIGKIFRNEGIDRTHNPEFTTLEAYAAYWDYNDMMSFVENLFAQLAEALFQKTTVTISKEDGTSLEIDFKAPWKRMSMVESIKVYANIDVEQLYKDELIEVLSQSPNVPKAGLNARTTGWLVASIFEEFVEEHLIQPHHITDHPIETTPFCKLHRDPALKQEGIVERFESFVLGVEMANAYSELNDPVLQRALLEQQQKGRDSASYDLDEDFISAICQGMPPAGGVGIGIDRLVMMLTGTTSIKDVLFFPL